MRRFTKRTVALSVVGLLFFGSAYAISSDKSEQRTVYIGSDANNMQAVVVTVPPARVSETRTVVSTYPENNTAYTSSYVNHYSNSSAYNPPSYTPPSYPNSTTSNYNNYNTYNNYNPTYTNNQLDRLVVSTESAAALVFDAQTGKAIYEKNVNSTRSIASITKMMTAMVVLDSGQSMRDELVVDASDLIGAKQASYHLRAGDRLSRSDLMLMMLMKSENPAAKTLARHYHGGYQAFIQKMNQKAQSLGMYNTQFSDTSGLDKRNVSTANDLVKMMREITTNPRYQTIRQQSTTPNHDFYVTNYNTGSRILKFSNTSRIVRSGNYALGASKTGHIREAGHCVVMEAYINGRPSIIVLLGANDSQKRWNDAETILGQLAYLR